jgi:hypothetical protein
MLQSVVELSWVRHPLMRRLLSPGGFVLVGICFFLPFVTVSCSAGRGSDTAAYAGTTTYTGTDLVTGGFGDLSIDNWPPADPSDPDVPSRGIGLIDHASAAPIAPQPFAIAALALVAVGLAAATVRPRFYRAMAETGLAVSAAILLCGAELLGQHAVRRTVTTDAAKVLGSSGSGTRLETTTRYGFWVALLLLAGLAVLGGLRLLRASRLPDHTSAKTEAATQAVPATE